MARYKMRQRWQSTSWRTIRMKGGDELISGMPKPGAVRAQINTGGPSWIDPTAAQRAEVGLVQAKGT